MNELTAFCGLDCGQCGAFIATKEDDDNKRAEVAALWSKMFNAEIEAKQINCSGCRTVEGAKFSHCNVCEIRRCARDKGVESCAFCEEYACAKLDPVINAVPEAREMLEGIRSRR